MEILDFYSSMQTMEIKLEAGGKLLTWFPPGTVVKFISFDFFVLTSCMRFKKNICFCFQHVFFNRVNLKDQTSILFQAGNLAFSFSSDLGNEERLIRLKFHLTQRAFLN